MRVAIATALALGGAQANAVCTFGSSSEPSLQSTFDTLLGSGTLDAVNACVDEGSDAAWTTIGSTGAVDIILELAGNRNTNSFGVYDLNDPTRRLTVFEGNDGVNSTATLRLRQLANGTWQVRVQELNNPSDPRDQHPNNWDRMAISTSAFGFYLSTAANGTFFSETGENADGADHMYAYRGTGTEFLSGPLSGELFTVQDFILAWEDLAGGGDRDYQDFVAVVTDIRPVPVPTAVWLFASGLIGLAGVARRNA